MTKKFSFDQNLCLYVSPHLFHISWFVCGTIKCIKEWHFNYHLTLMFEGLPLRSANKISYNLIYHVGVKNEEKIIMHSRSIWNKRQGVFNYIVASINLTVFLLKRKLKCTCLSLKRMHIRARILWLTHIVHLNWVSLTCVTWLVWAEQKSYIHRARRNQSTSERRHRKVS